MAATDALLEVIKQGVREAMAGAQSAPKRLYSVKETAEHLGLSLTTLKAMVANREIPAVRRGDRVLIDVQDIDRWIRDHKD